MADLYSKVMSRNLGLPTGVRYVDHQTTQTIQHKVFREVIQASVINTKQWSPQHVRNAITQHYQSSDSVSAQHTENTGTEQRQSGQHNEVVIPELPSNPKAIIQLLVFIQYTQAEGKMLVSDIMNTLVKRATELTITVDRGETYHFNATQIKDGLAAIIQRMSPEDLLKTDVRQLLVDTIRQQSEEESFTQQLVMAQIEEQGLPSDRGNSQRVEQPPISGHFETDATITDLLVAPVDGGFTGKTA